MAKEEVVIGVKVTSDGSGKKTLGDLKKEVESVKKSAKSTGDALGEGMKKAEAPAISLKTQLKNMKDELVTLDEGSVEFQNMAVEAAKLEDQIADVNSRVKFLASDTKKLDTVAQAGMGIAGGFQAAQGAMALFGTESAEVQKAIQKVIAVQGIMNGVMQVTKVLNKDSVLGNVLRIKALKAWALQTKVVTTVQKVFNAVMKANPIMLIVTGIMLLIGGLVLLANNVKSVGKFFSDLGRDIMIMFGPILEFFGIIDSGATESMKSQKAAEQQAKANKMAAADRNKAKLAEIASERKALREQHKEAQSDLDSQIEINELLGKSSTALTQQKLENQIAFDKEEKRLINEAIASWTKYYEELFVMSGKSREDFIAQMKGQGIDVEKLEQERIDINEKADAAIELSSAKLFKFKSDLAKTAAGEQKAINEAAIAAELEAAKKAGDRANRLNEKKRKDYIESEKQKEKDAKDVAKRTLKADKELEKLRLKAIDDEFEQKEAKLISQHEIALEGLSERIPAEKELIQALEAEHNEKMADLDEERRQSKIANIEAIAQKTLNSAKDVVGIIGSINSLANDKEIKRIKAKQSAGEKLSRAEEKRLIRDEKNKRKIALAEIAIDTAKGVAAAVASGASMPFPANIPAIIAGVAAVLANAATAAKIINEPLPDFGGGGGGSSEAGGVSATDSAPTINPVQEGSTLLNEPTKVTVTEQDITNAQTSVSVIEQEATF